MPNEDRSYATDNGFYEGDTVEFYGERTFIERIVSKGHWSWIGNEQHKCSIVKLANGKQTTDLRLTRVE